MDSVRDRAGRLAIRVQQIATSLALGGVAGHHFTKWSAKTPTSHQPELSLYLAIISLLLLLIFLGALITWTLADFPLKEFPHPTPSDNQLMNAAWVLFVCLVLVLFAGAPAWAWAHFAT